MSSWSPPRSLQGSGAQRAVLARVPCRRLAQKPSPHRSPLPKSAPLAEATALRRQPPPAAIAGRPQPRPLPPSAASRRPPVCPWRRSRACCQPNSCGRAERSSSRALWCVEGAASYRANTPRALPRRALAKLYLTNSHRSLISIPSCSCSSHPRVRGRSRWSATPVCISLGLGG